MTLDEIRRLIENAGPVTPVGRKIASGVLSDRYGAIKSFELLLGWDLQLATQCDQTWGTFNTSLLGHVREIQLVDEARAAAVLASLQLEDAHWDWLQKAAVYRGDEYKWFFLMAEGYPQGACLIYHPKPSAIDSQGIYYIEYLAAAPWNRTNPLGDRAFKGVGSTILSLVSSYATKELGLRPGFSLHALPKAIGFYQSIGMMAFPALDKAQLPYFEMPEDRCPMVA